MSNSELSPPGEIQDQIEQAMTGQKPDTQASNGSSEGFDGLLMEAMGINQEKEPDDGEIEESGSGRPADQGHGEPGEGLQSRSDDGSDQSKGQAEGEPGEAGEGDLREQRIADLAKELGTNAKRLYSISVDMGKDDPKTIGELKDAYRSQQEFEVEIAQREKALIEQTQSLREAQQTVMALQEDIQEHVDPEKLGRIREQQQAALATEGQRLRQAAPELAEEAAFGKFREDLVGFMGGYGFRPEELNIADHRILLVLRDAMNTKARLDRLANTKPQVGKPKAAKPKTVDTGKVPQREQMGTHPSDQVDQMAQLLMRA